MTATETVHVFEKAGLGKAPFKFVAVTENVFVSCPGAPPKAGGCCKYCSTGIRYEYWLESADGKRFEVGCECVKRSGDKGLIKIVAQKEKELKKELTHKRQDAQIEEAIALLPQCCGRLAEKPHPNKYLADQGKTMFNYVRYLLDNGGRSGKCSAAGIIRRAMEE